MVPTGKVLPEGMEEDWLTNPELSTAEGSSQLTTALAVPNGTVIVTSDGKLVTTGGVLSAVETEQQFKLETPLYVIKIHPKNSTHFALQIVLPFF